MSHTFIDVAMVLVIFSIGVAAGVSIRWHRSIPVPKESGLGSAVLLFKATTDKVLSECAAQREFATDIVTHLIDSNDKLANQCLAISEGALERIRIERENPPPTPREPFVDEFRADPGTPPEVVIQDRRNNHIG